MTTNELKSYIDRILGNNIRLLLPSYWWKRAFGVVIDKIDEVEKGGGSSITVDSELSETSENPVQNKVVTSAIQENEQTIATALTELDARIAELPTIDNVSDMIAVAVEEANAVYENVIKSNEKVTAAALNDLNNRMKNVETFGPEIEALSAFAEDTESRLNSKVDKTYVDETTNAAIGALAADFQFVVDDINNRKADKNYVDTSISNSITNTLNTAV